MQESFPQTKVRDEKSVDELLDERTILSRELERIGGKLENEKINHSDASNKEEQRNDEIEKVSDYDRINVLTEEIKKIDEQLKEKSK